MAVHPPFEYVFASVARRDTLVTVATEDGCTRRTAVERLDASESAVYDAFAGLTERGLLVRDGDQWTVTGAGRAVADCLDRCRRLDETLLADRAYWRTHTLDRLPRAIREELLVSPTVSVDRCDDVDRRLTALLEGTHSAGVLTRTVSSSLTAALDSVVDGRLVCETTALDDETTAHTPRSSTDPRRVPESERHGITDSDETSAHATAGDASIRTESRHRSRARSNARITCPIRYADVAYTMVVTDETVAFALPPVDSEATDGVVVVTDESLVTRCWRHFETRWDRATVQPSSNARSGSPPR